MVKQMENDMENGTGYRSTWIMMGGVVCTNSGFLIPKYPGPYYSKSSHMPSKPPVPFGHKTRNTRCWRLVGCVNPLTSKALLGLKVHATRKPIQSNSKLNIS